MNKIFLINIILLLSFMNSCFLFGQNICKEYNECIEIGNERFMENVDKYVENSNEYYENTRRYYLRAVKLARSDEEKSNAYLQLAKNAIADGNIVDVIKYSRKALKFNPKSGEAEYLLFFNELIIADLYKRDVPELLNRLHNRLIEKEKRGEYFENMYFLWAMFCLENCEKEETLRVIEKSEKYDKNVKKSNLDMFRTLIKSGANKDNSCDDDD